ncbi:hypothetical protein BS78_01G234300 [Paspalum vaginatum]|nr:hypothetical protein BS78_01G234300 [Paspalum vaginatum]
MPRTLFSIQLDGLFTARRKIKTAHLQIHLPLVHICTKCITLAARARTVEQLSPPAEKKLSQSNGLLLEVKAHCSCSRSSPSSCPCGPPCPNHGHGGKLQPLPRLHRRHLQRRAVQRRADQPGLPGRLHPRLRHRLHHRHQPPFPDQRPVQHLLAGHGADALRRGRHQAEQPERARGRQPRRRHRERHPGALQPHLRRLVGPERRHLPHPHGPGVQPGRHRRRLRAVPGRRRPGHLRRVHRAAGGGAQGQRGDPVRVHRAVRRRRRAEPLPGAVGGLRHRHRLRQLPVLRVRRGHDGGPVRRPLRRPDRQLPRRQHPGQLHHGADDHLGTHRHGAHRVPDAAVAGQALRDLHLGRGLLQEPRVPVRNTGAGTAGQFVVVLFRRTCTE